MRWFWHHYEDGEEVGMRLPGGREIRGEAFQKDLKISENQPHVTPSRALHYTVHRRRCQAFVCDSAPADRAFCAFIESCRSVALC